MDALSGIRVVEFSGGMVGPLAADVLARTGAEVIKVESRRRLDFARLFRDPVAKVPPKLNEGRRFNDLNLDKLGVCMDLSKPEACVLAKRLVVQCDVLLENFSAGTIDRLGLGYDVVSRLRPDIIMISASGSGRGGPDGGTLALAPVFAAMGGLADLTGYDDGDPFESRGSCDATNAFTVVFAILAALCYREKTGYGQYIDYSSREGLSSLVGDAFMDYFMNGRVQRRRANRDDFMAPHNCYRCTGEDRWISIAVGTEKEWHALVEAMGNPQWASDEKFGDALSRWRNQEDMDWHVNQWTMRYAVQEVVDRLQRVGVAAFPTFTAEDFYSDPHLDARHAFTIVEHPVFGASVEMVGPWKLSATPMQNRRHAPLFGEHNTYIFGDLLGIAPAEISQLETDQILW